MPKRSSGSSACPPTRSPTQPPPERPTTARTPAPQPRLNILCARGELPVPERRPLVMGILNVTPDSFSDGGAFLDPKRALARGLEMADEGADLIDIGGASTRPGAREISLDEELRRTIPVVERLAAKVRIPLSIDTSKAKVAARALQAGAAMVNDVTAMRGDPQMAEVVAHHRAAIILMHMQGTPRTMQQQPRYADVVEAVTAFVSRAATHAVEQGIPPRAILVDPGIGFGKTVAHNLILLRSLSSLVALGYPVAIGPSRKSVIGQTLRVGVEDRLAGTLACVASAMQQGVHLVRVHDVRPTAQLIRMLEAINHASIVT